MKHCICLLLIGLHLSAVAAAQAAKPNVLLIMSDDLAATLSSYGYPQAKTPHLDALASRGILFERAYCQFPHCNPSRSSMLSGMRPNITRVTNNEDNLYKNHPGVMTLPHYFRSQGYTTARCGKIFHLGVPSGLESMDDPEGWDFGTPFKNELPYPPKRPSTVKVKTGKKQGIGWQEIIGEDDDMCDGTFAKTAIDWLEKRDTTKPFLLAIGFHRPHAPLVAPAKYFDLYPFDSITLPDAPADDEGDIPPPARNGAVPGYTVNATQDQRRAAIRAYLAAVSYMDAQAGRLLDALKRTGLDENTIVVFTSDHGWHLGEHGLWHKRSLFEECARVPFFIYAPGTKGRGQRCSSLVEMLDIFPTLCDLCDLPSLPQFEGKSLRPLLNDPNTTVHEYAFTQARRGANAEFWGRSVRTPRWRYTEWDEGMNGSELYDHESDPHEYTNLANLPEHAAMIKELHAILAAQLPPMAP